MHCSVDDESLTKEGMAQSWNIQFVRQPTNSQNLSFSTQIFQRYLIASA